MQIEMKTQDVLKQIDLSMSLIKDKIFKLEHIKSRATDFKTYDEQIIKAKLEMQYSGLNSYRNMCLNNISDTVILDSESYYSIYEEQCEGDNQ